MEPYFSKFINISQIYSEPGINFENVLNVKKVREWRVNLDQNLLPEGIMTRKYSGYILDLILTTSKDLTELKIKGPIKGRKNKYIEYVIWIPYLAVMNSHNPLSKLTDYVKLGIVEILTNLEYSDESIEKSIKGITF
jgi:hypothetical protein